MDGDETVESLRALELDAGAFEERGPTVDLIISKVLVMLQTPGSKLFYRGLLTYHGVSKCWVRSHNYGAILRLTDNILRESSNWPEQDFLMFAGDAHDRLFMLALEACREFPESARELLEVASSALMAAATRQIHAIQLSDVSIFNRLVNASRDYSNG